MRPDVSPQNIGLSQPPRRFHETLEDILEPSSVLGNMGFFEMMNRLFQGAALPPQLRQ
jgi:hypothetical protein